MWRVELTVGVPLVLLLLLLLLSLLLRRMLRLLSLAMHSVCNRSCFFLVVLLLLPPPLLCFCAVLEFACWQAVLSFALVGTALCWLLCLQVLAATAVDTNVNHNNAAGADPVLPMPLALLLLR